MVINIESFFRGQEMRVVLQHITENYITCFKLFSILILVLNIFYNDKTMNYYFLAVIN